MKSQPWYITPKINPPIKRAVIIGGGLAGTSAAYSLAIRGWKITIIDKSSAFASGASGNPVGILTPLITHKKDPIGEFYLRGFEHSLKHLQQLSSQIDFNNCGVLELSKAKIGKDLADNIIQTDDIAAISGQQATQLSGIKINSSAIYMKKCGFVNPAHLCKANILQGGNNIEIIFSKNISSLAQNNGIWSVLDEQSVTIASAPVVIIANAADAINFKQTSWIGMQPVRGQLTYLPNQSLNLKKILCYDGGYITPEIGGFHYVGATYNRDNLSLDVNAADHVTNIKNLQQIIDIGDTDFTTLQGRASFRATSIDRRPVIGPVPDIKAFYNDYPDLHHGRKYKQYPPGKYLMGLYISSGFGSRGLTGCPIGGELLAAMINNEKLPLTENIVNILNPARFVIKELKSSNKPNFGNI